MMTGTFLHACCLYFWGPPGLCLCCRLFTHSPFSCLVLS